MRSMSMHVKVLGVLNIILGIYGLMGALLIFMSMAQGPDAPQEPEVAFMVGGLGTAIALFTTALSFPCLAGGYGLIRLYDWSRVLMLVISFLNILNFPFGTIIGGYGIWVLIQKATDKVFDIENKEQSTISSEVNDATKH